VTPGQKAAKAWPDVTAAANTGITRLPVGWRNNDSARIEISRSAENASFRIPLLAVAHLDASGMQKFAVLLIFFHRSSRWGQTIIFD